MSNRILIPIRRLTAASSNFGLHLLTKTPDVEENIFPFGGGLSGHHGLVSDMTFCGGPTDDIARYVATVSGARHPWPHTHAFIYLSPLTTKPISLHLPTNQNQHHQLSQNNTRQKMTKCSWSGTSAQTWTSPQDLNRAPAPAHSHPPQPPVPARPTPHRPAAPAHSRPPT